MTGRIENPAAFKPNSRAGHAAAFCKPADDTKREFSTLA